MDIENTIQPESLAGLKPSQILNIPKNFTGRIEISYDDNIVTYIFKNDLLINVSYE